MPGVAVNVNWSGCVGAAQTTVLAWPCATGINRRSASAASATTPGNRLAGNAAVRFLETDASGVFIEAVVGAAVRPPQRPSVGSSARRLGLGV